MNLTESRHHVVRFVRREVVIESVDLQVVVNVVRAAFETSLGSFAVLQRGKLVSVSCQKFLKIILYEAY